MLKFLNNYKLSFSFIHDMAARLKLFSTCIRIVFSVHPSTFIQAIKIILKSKGG
jgi:energy-coupling factor transporter transmembrane protein EcfT